MGRDGHVQMKLRLVAWLILYLPLLVVGAGALLGKAVSAGDDRLEVIGYVVAAVALVCLLGILVLVAKTDCPVCFARIFGAARCSRHREARRVMGSTRLGMLAQAVFVIDSLRCRFCGVRILAAEDEVRVERPSWNEIDELYSLEVRTRKRGGRQERPARPVQGAMPERRSRTRSGMGVVPAGRLRSAKAKVPARR